MRKTFPLQIEGKHPDRLLDATKHEIRKYLKRERSRPLPPGVDYWDFACQFGPSKETAAPIGVGAIIAAVDALTKEGGSQFYLEILAAHGKRQAPPVRGPVEPPIAAPYLGDAG